MIDFYIWILRHREQSKAIHDTSYKKKYIGTTYLFWKLILAHNESTTLGERNSILRRMATRDHRRMDVFKFAALLIPANLNNIHWVWFLIHPETRSIHAYDGFRSSLRRFFPMFLNWLQVEAAKEECTFDFQLDQWTFVDEDGPIQTNVFDCGMYLLKGIEYACDDLPLSYTENDMPYHRKALLIHTLNGKLDDPFSQENISDLPGEGGYNDGNYGIEEDEDVVIVQRLTGEAIPGKKGKYAGKRGSDTRKNQNLKIDFSALGDAQSVKEEEQLQQAIRASLVSYWNEYKTM